MTDRICPFDTATIRYGFQGVIEVTVTPDIPSTGRGRRLVAALRDDNNNWHHIDEQTQALLLALMVDEVDAIHTDEKTAFITWHNSAVTFSVMAERIAFSLKLHRIMAADQVSIVPDRSVASPIRPVQDAILSGWGWPELPFQWQFRPASWTLRSGADRLRMQSIFRDHIPSTPDADTATVDFDAFRRWMEDQSDALAETPATPFYGVSYYDNGMWLEPVDPPAMSEDGGPYVMFMPALDAASAEKAARIMHAVSRDPDLADRILAMMETED